jgi:hypothetical protein
MRSELDDIRDFLPPGTRFFIAGGWAADPDKASDIDVWVSTDNVDWTRQLLLNYLVESLVTFTEEHSKEGEESYLADIHTPVRKVAYIPFQPKPIHLLAVEGGVYDTLEGFDISTHQIAINDDGEIIKGSRWTPTTVPPIVLIETGTTEARLQKIAERYGHTC